MLRGFALTLVTAALEIAAFVLLGETIGYGWTILVVLALSVLGMSLLRREGIRAWRGFLASANAGQPPGDRVVDGIVGLGAGLLLTVPGLVSGLAGLLLLLPPVRGLGRRGLQRWAERKVSTAMAGDLFGPRRVKVHRGSPPASDDAIEGEVV